MKNNNDLHDVSGHSQPVPPKARNRGWLYVFGPATILLLGLLVLLPASIALAAERDFTLRYDVVAPGANLAFYGPGTSGDMIDGIQQLAASFMKAPLQVRAAALHEESQIEQRFYEIDPAQRLPAVLRLLAHFRPESCVAFCFTKQQCQELVDFLAAKGISAAALHGDLEQRDRDQVLAMFANRSLSVLVATDVAARGLDVDALDMVINVELARDPEVHIHRIGRTGRAGKSGMALSLAAPAEAQRAQAIETLQQRPLNWQPLEALKPQAGEPLQPPMVTLCIAAGRKDKLRPGDILGALTGEAGLAGGQVGKIALFDFQALVAVERGVARQALKRLSEGKIKGRSLRVRQL